LNYCLFNFWFNIHLICIILVIFHPIIQFKRAILTFARFGMSDGWNLNICDDEKPVPPLLRWFSLKRSRILQFFETFAGLKDYRWGKCWRSRDSDWVLVYKFKQLWCREPRATITLVIFAQKFTKSSVFCDFLLLLVGDTLEVVRFGVISGLNSNSCDVENPGPP